MIDPKKLPKYVRLGNTAMRLKEGAKQYWRDAGLWGVDYRIKKGKLIAWCPNIGLDYLHRVELIEISEDEWRKANEGYI